MKKVILTLFAILGMSSMLEAQITDTVYGIKRSYYVGNTSYYEECIDSHPTCGVWPLTDAPGCKSIYAQQMMTTRPMVVYGMAVNVRDIRDRLPINNYYRDEYVFISQFDTAKRSMDYLAIARWDTATPHTTAFIMTHNPATYNFRSTCPDGYLYCRTYEAYFDNPIIVDSAFCVGGTYFGNEDPRTPTAGLYSMYKQVSYVKIATNDPHCITRYPYYQCLYRGSDSTWYIFNTGDTNLEGSGPSYGIANSQCDFLPIVSYQWLVTVSSADISRGLAYGGHYYTDSTEATLTAVGNSGYTFDYWSDGCTDNPRTITVTSDTNFVAFFRPLKQLHVKARSNNKSLGLVSGSGTYTEFDSVTLQALAWPGNSFLKWSDGDTNAIRKFCLTRDTLFTAIFIKKQINEIDEDASAPAFSITPNPAHDRVTVTLSDSPAHASLVLRDAVGKELLRLSPVSQKTDIPLRDLPAGTYLLTLSSPQGSSTQKLIVE